MTRPAPQLTAAQKALLRRLRTEGPQRRDLLPETVLDPLLRRGIVVNEGPMVRVLGNWQGDGAGGAA